MDKDTDGKQIFISDKKFSKECRIFKYPMGKEVIDIFIFKNKR
jgi:hypothetical protein